MTLLVALHSSLTTRALISGLPAKAIAHHIGSKSRLPPQYLPSCRHDFTVCASTTGSPENSSEIKRLVFLGSPSVAADTLQSLYDASIAKNPDSVYDIVAVVSQPPAPAGRKKKLQSSPVHNLADDLELPLLIPESAKDPEFLSKLENLNVDICITAAYGNFLPKKFLAIPKYGTVNIHPSLLPKYRGAAPVQRCLENGDESTGVSVAFTVLKMDAGPIIKQVPYPLTGDEKATQVLSDCFRIGTQALIDVLPGIFTGQVETTPQDDDHATPADKLSSADAVVDFATMTASTIHNRCRGYADWPGIAGYFFIGKEATEPEKIKVITTHMLDPSPNKESPMEDDAAATAEVLPDRVEIIKNCAVSVAQPKVGQSLPVGQELKQEKRDVLKVVCKDNTVLGISELQPPSKKIMPVKAFINGLRGDTSIRWSPVPPANK